MTNQEWARMVTILKCAYTKKDFLPNSQSIQVWFDLLKDIEGKVLETAIIKHITTNVFPPSVAELRALCIPVETSEWSVEYGKVMKLISKYGQYNVKKAYEEMEPITRKVVERLGFENMCLSEEPEMDRANFRMAYQAEVNRIEHDQAMPKQYRNPQLDYINDRLGGMLSDSTT